MSVSSPVFWKLDNVPSTLLTSGFLLMVWLTASTAQVTTSITPDGTLGTDVRQRVNLHEIIGGTRPGNGSNLFHSFGLFNVGTDDTAHFIGQQGVENIIGRVTGGAESMIDGRVRADANLFLLNPSGIMFGPNASLDVNGSFHGSTADVLRFGDGKAFVAHVSEESTLTAAAPSTFGFLNANPEGITIQGSTLAVPEGGNLGNCWRQY